MRFQVKGFHPVEGVVSLAFEAATPEQARSQAIERGIEIITVERHWRHGLSLGARQARFDLLLFSQEMRSLLAAGLSVIETLSAISRKESPSRKRDIVDRLIRQIKDGKPFSLALRAYPDDFPPLYLALAAASEKTGDLGNALGRYVAYRTRMDEVRKRIVSALLYPALLVGVGGLVVLFLMGYVVPRFARIYEDFGRELPWVSRLLMSWGSLVGTHGGTLLVILLGLVGVSIVLFRRNGAQGILARVAGFAVVRKGLQQYELSRFYRTVGILEQGGIPLVSALDMAADLLGREQRERLEQAIRDIRAGTAFSEAMARANLAPPVALDLLRVGERTGALGEKMTSIAEFYDEEQSRWIDWFARLFEPLLMLTIGIIIAGIVVLLYLPIFELAGNIQ